MIKPKQTKMFRSISNLFTQSVSAPERSRSPSPILRSASSTVPTLSPTLKERLEKICETPPPATEPEPASPVPASPEPASPVPAVPDVEELESEKNIKTKIMAPPMHYDLHKADAAFVYSHIKELTKNDTVASEYLEQIKPLMFAQQKPLVFGYIPAPPVEQIVKQVIGSKGYFFKMTTVVSGVYFIWHDTEANMFLFWGPSTFKIVKAMNSIRWRIFKYCQDYSAQQIDLVYDAKCEDAKCEDAKCEDAKHEEDADDDDTDDDMPALVSMEECQQISCGSVPDNEMPELC